jgi:hypothetical protein
MHPSRLLPVVHVPVIASALLVGACVSGDAPPDLSAIGDLDLTPIAPAGDQWNDCSTWDCNKNHPELTKFPLPELNEDGLPSEEGFRIVSFVSASNTAYKFDVTRGEIRGLDAQGKPALTGPNVRNSVITVTNDVNTWYIQIADYNRELPYWVGSGGVPAYHLVYMPKGGVGSQWANVCKEPPVPASDPLWPGGFETFAILIDDERYDRDQITVEPDDAAADGWFNIACAGTALAKMIRLHLDPKIPEGHPFHTTKAQRTATLKMLTADYFGTGQAFTQPGQDLWWMSAMGWHPLLPDQENINPEAVWTETGARCLNTPRRFDDDPDILDQLEAYRQAKQLDPLPICNEFTTPPTWLAGDVWHTFNTW